MQDDRQKEEIRSSSLIGVIRQAMPLGLRHIKLTGGEPLLNADLPALVRFAATKKLRVTIETNGTLLDDRASALFKKCGVSMVSVSLDGHSARIHEALRKTKGSFKKAVLGLRSLKKYGINTEAVMTVHKGNAADIGQTAELARRAGVQRLKVNCLLQVGRGRDLGLKGRALGVREYLRLNRQIEKENRHRPGMPVYLDIPVAFKTIKDLKDRVYYCSIKNTLGILSDGSISICGIGHAARALNFGSIERDPLAGVWTNNEVLRSLRLGLPGGLKGVCARCIFKGLCLGKCRAEAYYLTGDLLAPFAFCEQAYQQGLFPERNLYPQEAAWKSIR